MADLSITASQVLRVSGDVVTGLAGATITAGQSVYLDTSTNTWKLAQADGTAVEAGYGTDFGISLHGASSGQPIDVQINGDIQPGAGAAAAAGIVYCVSAAAGGICPLADITTGQYLTVLGSGMGSTKIRMARNAAVVVKA